MDNKFNNTRWSLYKCKVVYFKVVMCHAFISIHNHKLDYTVIVHIEYILLYLKPTLMWHVCHTQVFGLAMAAGTFDVSI